MSPLSPSAVNAPYFAHGRWYNQDTGLWLSPNDVGDYLYGGHGQDPVNTGWVAGTNNPWWKDNNKYQPNDGYQCSPTLGCVGEIPLITARCRRDFCELDSRLDQAVRFYTGLYEIPYGLLNTALITEYMNDRQPGQDAVDIYNFTNAANAKFGISLGEQRSGEMGLGLMNILEGYLHPQGNPGAGFNNIHSETAWFTQDYFANTYPGTPMQNLLIEDSNKHCTNSVITI